MTSDLSKMRVLGVDPGTITMGYGVIETGGDEITLVDYGAQYFDALPDWGAFKLFV